jgi:hypothetical protein
LFVFDKVFELGVEFLGYAYVKRKCHCNHKKQNGKLKPRLVLYIREGVGSAEQQVSEKSALNKGYRQQKQ